MLVESSIKKGRLQHFLGQRCTIIATMGHIRELQTGRDSVNPDSGFNGAWRIMDDKLSLVNRISDVVELV